VTEPYYEIGDESPQELLGRVAARYVQDLAPAPNPVTPDYRKNAAAAEYLVLDYLMSSKGGSVTSVTVGTASMTFKDIEKIEALIAPVMGEYFVGSSASADYNTAYISRG